MFIEHKRIDELRDKLSVIFKQEALLSHILTNITDREHDMEGLLHELAHARWDNAKDASYRSKKDFRIEIFEHMMHVILEIVSAMHDGQATSQYGAEIIAESGGNGVNEVYFGSVSATGDEYIVRFFYDTGINRYGAYSSLNDSAMITAPDRTYLVRTGFVPGGPLGVGEVRLTGSLEANCGFFHAGEGGYRAIGEGVLNCEIGRAHV